jgi:iron complex outermembrane recepter protein
MRIIIALCALEMAMGVGVAVAEDTPVEETTRLEEIVVTATRREESLSRVPVSIAAMSQDDIAAGAIKSIEDIATVTPGVQFQRDGYAATLSLISIRGLDSLFGASTVGIYADDTPIQSRLSSDGNVGNPYPALFDLNRIEVLRGPQGTLFGAGSEMGNVRFISNQPSLTQFSGFTHAEVASTQNGSLSYEEGAAAGGPIIDNELGFRASVWERHDGGYEDRVQPWSGDVTARNTNQSRNFATRLALGIQAADGVLVTPSVLYQEARVEDNGRFDPNFSNPSAGQFNSATLLPENSVDRLIIPSAKLEGHLSFADLTAVASYTHRSVALTSDLSGLLGAIGLVNYGNPLSTTYASSQADVSPLYTGTSVHAYTEEVRLTSNDKNAFFTWVAGVFDDHRNQTDYQLQFSQLLDPSGHEIFYTLQSVVDDQLAAYAQGDFHFTQQWTGTLGMRVAKVKTEQVNNNGTGALDAVPAYAQIELSQTPTTPRLAISYQLNPDNLFYASASKGFRIGGGNDPLPPICDYSAVPKSYTADYVWNYEVGAKNKLFDGRLALDSSVFHIVWSNIQQLGQPSCGISYTFNGGGAVSNGFDFALQAIPVEHVRVDLSVAYADAKYTSTVLDGQGHVLLQDGDQVGFLPFVHAPWDIDTAANYELPLPNGQKAHARIEYQYHSRNPGPFLNQITTSPNYSPQEAQDPATNLVNARLGWSKSRLDVSLFCNNVFNSHPLLDRYGQSTVEAVTYGTFRPRTVGVTGNYAF